MIALEVGIDLSALLSCQFWNGFHSSQDPPRAISPPARHFSEIEHGNEILRGARGHFELPGNQACR